MHTCKTIMHVALLVQEVCRRRPPPDVIKSMIKDIAQEDTCGDLGACQLEGVHAVPVPCILQPVTIERVAVGIRVEPTAVSHIVGPGAWHVQTHEQGSKFTICKLFTQTQTYKQTYKHIYIHAHTNQTYTHTHMHIPAQHSLEANLTLTSNTDIPHFSAPPSPSI